jgi:hypothetical protein
MMFADPATEDHRDRSAMKDQIAAELDLGEEQAMLTRSFRVLFRGEDRGQEGEPFVAASYQVAGIKRVGELLETLGRRALDEGIGALREGDVSSCMRLASQ